MNHDFLEMPFYELGCFSLRSGQQGRVSIVVAGMESSFGTEARAWARDRIKENH
jgi:hypothetical protein